MKFPSIISFIFDLSSKDEEDLFQYYNLESLLNDYKQFITEKLYIGENYYILKGTINQISINHYTASLLNIKHEDKNILEKNIYYYDGQNNNNQIIQLNDDNDYNAVNRVNYLLNKKPLILIYLKEYN